MSSSYIPKALREQVALDARQRCGYCLAQQEIIGIQLHIEHIQPEATGGATVRENLWLACSECNNHKGAQVDAIDPESGERMPLFHPRVQKWAEHFAWRNEGTRIVGLSAVGRATVIALDLNQPFMLLARRRWAMVGRHPPRD